MFWSKEIIHDQTHPLNNRCHQINSVRVCISLLASCWCYRWLGGGHKPPLLAVWSYFTALYRPFV